MFGQEFLQLLGVGPIVLAVLVAFWKGDDVLSTEARGDLSRWLKGVDLPEQVPWAAVVEVQFRRLFGERMISPRAIAISAFLSLGWLVLVWIAMTISNGGPVGFPGRGLSMAMYLESFINTVRLFGPGAVLYSFVSVVATRLILQSLMRRRLGIGVALILDALIAFAFLLIGLMTAELIDEGSLNPAVLLNEVMFNLFYRGATPGSELFGIYLTYWQSYYFMQFVAVFAGSLWIWSAAFGAMLMRLLPTAGRLLRFAQYALPIDEKPVRALGVAAAIGVAIPLCILALIPI